MSSNTENLNGENDAQTEEKSEAHEDSNKVEAPCEETSKTAESDEDIPGDFFDDFLKEDFMAGLDIVDDDEWDEEKSKTVAEDTENSKQEEKPADKESTESTKKGKSSKPSSKNTDVKLREREKEKRNKQKKKKRDEKDDSRRQKRSSDKRIDADEFDIRRDPEKTKRDIAKDKVRCEKDKEMKIISEKLSLVETGLVPPGTEMEIDIEEVKRQKEKMEKSPRDLREHLKDLKERNKSPGHKSRSPIRRRSLPRKSPIVPSQSRRLSPLASRRRSRSPRVNSVRSIISPARRSPRRRVSPRRSPLRGISPRRRSLERRRRSRSHSPFQRNRLDRYSPKRRRDRSSSRDSDRERWLKRRNRSRSPRRKRDEKKSFLQEIAEKLNEIRREPVSVMPSIPPGQPLQPVLQPPTLQPLQPNLHYIQAQPLPLAPVPAPAPVPPPIVGPVFPTPQPESKPQQYDPYDQSFFIGTSQPVNTGNFKLQPNIFPSGSQRLLTPISIQSMNSPPVTTGSLAPNAKTANPVNLPIPMPVHTEQTQQIQSKSGPQTPEEVAKLFQDKQITLSEFLAITAKPEVFSASPQHLQEKIKVISRCHEAIKILQSCEKKFSGKLTVHKTNKYSVISGNHVSPLKGTPTVMFPFTNAALTNDRTTSFSTFLNDLLQRLGLLKDTVVNIEDEDLSEGPIPGGANEVKYSPPPPPMIMPVNNVIVNEPNITGYSNYINSNRLSKMIQTDIFKCQSCEKRKKILFRSAGIQADTSTITFSVSTQVTEEDFNPKLPKTQSLAALTPAQLLAKSRENLNSATRGNRLLDVDDFDIGPSNYPRSGTFREGGGFGLSRNSLPNFPPGLSTMFDTSNPQASGVGGARGRELNVPRGSDPRFYNYYY